MLNKLILYNFRAGFTPQVTHEGEFLLQTCQRTIVIGYENLNINNIDRSDSYEVKRGKEAYSYLLEITCGLKSKLLGENEIVGQFKKAYIDYLYQNSRNNKILSILEKLLKDTKEIRTKYLIGIGQKTYASITRRQIYNRHKAQKVLILGSGQMAEDLINQFKKKCEVYMCARNEEALDSLNLNHDFRRVCWRNYADMIQFPFIANTIGHESVLFNNIFFKNWAERHDDKVFVDLGSPSAIRTDLALDDGVMRLKDIFNEGAIKENHKRDQILKAKNAMDELVEKRHQIFQKKLDSKKFQYVS